MGFTLAIRIQRVYQSRPTTERSARIAFSLTTGYIVHAIWSLMRDRIRIHHALSVSAAIVRLF